MNAYSAFQVACPFCVHTNLGLTNEWMAKLHHFVCAVLSLVNPKFECSMNGQAALYLFWLQKSVILHSFGKRSSNWVFTVSLGGMSEISDKKNPRRLRCGPSALYSGFRNFEVSFLWVRRVYEWLWVVSGGEWVRWRPVPLTFVHVGLRLGSSLVWALVSGRGHGRRDNFLGNLTRGRWRASGRKRSFTSVLELESFVQVKEILPGLYTGK